VVGCINAGSDVTKERTIRKESWYARVEDPTVFPIMPSEPTFFLEGTSGIKGFVVSLAPSVKIVSLGDCNQTGLQLNIKRAARKVEPGLIEVVGLAHRPVFVLRQLSGG